MAGWFVGMMGGIFQQESSRYSSYSLIEITKIAAAVSIPAAVIAVRGRWWVELKGESQVEGPMGRFLN